MFFAEPGARTDELLAELWERGTKGVIEEEGGLRAFFEDNVSPAAITVLVAGREPVVREEPDAVCSTRANEGDPILVGNRFFIAPPTDGQTVPDGRLWLKIDSPIAFGTGRHETTQLCLEAMERVVKPGQTIVDVGCGSGILSAAAELLGAKRVVSCDIHGDAVGAARTTLGTPVFLGSADALPDHVADVVLANISAKVLDRLAFDLKRITKRSGRAIISGFLASNVPECFVARERFELQEWQCWICEPGTINGTAASGNLSHEEDWWL